MVPLHVTRCTCAWFRVVDPDSSTGTDAIDEDAAVLGGFCGRIVIILGMVKGRDLINCLNLFSDSTWETNSRRPYRGVCNCKCFTAEPYSCEAKNSRDGYGDSVACLSIHSCVTLA